MKPPPPGAQVERVEGALEEGADGVPPWTRRERAEGTLGKEGLEGSAWSLKGARGQGEMGEICGGPPGSGELTGG